MEILGKWVGCAVVGKMIVGYAISNFSNLNLHVVGVEPKHMGISPVAAINKVLAQVGLTKEDIDVYEVSHSKAI